MSKYIHINEDVNIKCNKTVKEFLNPDYIYIPYYDGYELKVKNHELIKKNSIIMQKGDDSFVYSSISGEVVGIAENIVNNKTMKTIVIENDFKENSIRSKGVKSNISNLVRGSIEPLIRILNAYKGELNGNTLLVSGIDYEPYENTMSYLISEHTDELLDGMDAIYKIFGIHKCIFAIKNNDSENVTALINQIGTYPNISLKLVDDVYPIGMKEVLIKELVLPSKIENGVIFLTVEDVYAIYNVLKRRYPVTEKLITVTGNMLNKSKVVKVKIGTKIRDIIDNEFKIIDVDYHIIINGLISGYEVASLDTIVTSDVRSIFINSLDNSLKSKCINCGLCFNMCPVGCNPRMNKKMDKCIKCGLCSYVCPAKLDLGGKR